METIITVPPDIKGIKEGEWIDYDVSLHTYYDEITVIITCENASIKADSRMTHSEKIIVNSTSNSKTNVHHSDKQSVVEHSIVNYCSSNGYIIVKYE